MQLNPLQKFCLRLGRLALANKFREFLYLHVHAIHLLSNEWRELITEAARIASTSQEADFNVGEAPSFGC